jgi:hypothetical protein
MVKIKTTIVVISLIVILVLSSGCMLIPPTNPVIDNLLTQPTITTSISIPNVQWTIDQYYHVGTFLLPNSGNYSVYATTTDRYSRADGEFDYTTSNSNSDRFGSYSVPVSNSQSLGYTDEYNIINTTISIPYGVTSPQILFLAYNENPVVLNVTITKLE